MDVIDLLDKHQKTGFRIMQALINPPFYTTIDSLLTEIQVSIPTIQKELFQLKEELHTYDQKADLLITDKNIVSLQLPLNFSFKQFFYDSYYSQAINLQLIETFYFQRDISIARLTMSFQLSESSLFRRLKQINLLFRDFDLKYKNNRLIGSASAYHLFYFDFFATIYPKNRLNKQFNHSKFYHLIKIIESNLHGDFTKKQADEFVLWLAIAEQKINDSLLNSLNKKKKILLTIDSFEYKELEQIFMRFSSRYAIQWPQYEIVSAYHFLLSEGVIRYTYTDAITSTYLKKIDTLTRNIAQSLSPNSLSNKKIIYPNLFMAHCQLLFFHHIISNDFATHYLLTDINNQRMEQCMQIVEKHVTFAISTNQWQKLDAIYGRLYHFIDKKKKNKQVDQSIFLHMTDSLLIEETKELVSEMKHKFPAVSLHITTLISQADLILADQETAPYRKKIPYYRMQEYYWTPYESRRLYLFLQELLGKKGWEK